MEPCRGRVETGFDIRVDGQEVWTGEYTDFRAGVGTLVKSAVYLAFTIVFVVLMFGLHRYSRVQVFATCGALLGLELLVRGAAVRFGAGGKFWPGRAGEDAADAEEVSAVPAGRAGFSFKFALVDLGLFFVAFFAVNYLKRGHFDLLPAYDRLMVMQVVLGAAAAIATRKFYQIAGSGLRYCSYWGVKYRGLGLSGGLIPIYIGILTDSVSMLS